ncbi:MAG: TIGR03790 family protein [Deltaproteobacteria bacterium]|nr:TIGR03790 family protein [Deltaproteobacteria bacterium]
MSAYRLPFIFIIFIIFLRVLLPPASGAALVPSQVAVIANQRVPESLKLARFYMAKRGIPAANLIIIKTTHREQISRFAYEHEIAKPVRDYLDERYGEIKCLVLMFGLPLKIKAPKLSFMDTSALKRLRRRRNMIRQSGDKDKLKIVNRGIKKLRKTNQRAAVDSEIALVRQGDYPLTGWLPNPAYLGWQGRKNGLVKRRLLMVSRLDGPTPEVVKRIINDALTAEKKGLSGKAFFDARWPRPLPGRKLTGYAFYDNSIHQAAALLRKKMPVVLDDRPALFPAGAHLPAALYCGWYSLGKYINAFDWQVGSVGYHIASSECATLKRPGSRVWCKVMLEKGICATLGPVNEPYVQAFPPPAMFFDLLTDGRFDLAESYMLSLPFLSWQMVLIGDPLYKVNLTGQRGVVNNSGV